MLEQSGVPLHERNVKVRQSEFRQPGAHLQFHHISQKYYYSNIRKQLQEVQQIWGACKAV